MSFEEICEEYRVSQEDIAGALGYAIAVLDAPYSNEEGEKQMIQNQETGKVCSKCEHFKPTGYTLYGMYGACMNDQCPISNTAAGWTCEFWENKNKERDAKKEVVANERCIGCKHLGVRDMGFGVEFPACKLIGGAIIIGNDKCESWESQDNFKESNLEGDLVSHPNHYCQGRKYEPVKVIQDWKLNFALGSAVKYIARAGRKNDAVQDLQKAIRYIEFEIERIENGNLMQEESHE